MNLINIDVRLIIVVIVALAALCVMLDVALRHLDERPAPRFPVGEYSKRTGIVYRPERKW